MISGRDAALIRRIVNLPMSIAEGVSRAVGQGMNRFGVGRRERRIHYPPHEDVQRTPEEWVFLKSFEHEYGSFHPFFYACQFIEALKMAEEDKKFLFVYLHSPEHPYTPPFCRETLCSELVVQYLDANFVSWGAIANRGEGLQMGSTLRADTFPYCAVVVPVSGDSIAVLQHVEGPVTPSELVEILQRAIEEQGSAFMNPRAAESRTPVRAAEAERVVADRQLRKEQDAAYNAALQMDKERDRIRNLTIEGDRPTERPVTSKSWNHENAKKNSQATQATKQSGAKPKDSQRESQRRADVTAGKNSSVTLIQIRFPNGERREKSFDSSDKIHSIYRFIDSLNLPGIGSYRLISNFPRRVYGFEQLNMTIKDADLHPRASLLLELL